MRPMLIARLLIPVAASLVLPIATIAQEAKPKPPAKKKPLALQPVEEVVGLPRVLLIGDSISIGYTIPVREKLSGKANVHRIAANGGPTIRGLASIDRWLGEKPWDVIHFNFGIHDLRHMENGQRQVEPENYQKNLQKLVARLKKTDATLIFATTTPIPKGKLNPDRTFGDETEYNTIATKVMQENGIAINDLHSHIMPSFEEFHRDRDLHFKPEGSEFLAEKVAQEIESHLPVKNGT